MLRKYLKTALYPDGLEKVNKTLKMQMKEKDVIYPSRTSLGGEKETVKGLVYNNTFLTSIFFIWICHFTVSCETALRLYVYSDERRRCD